MKQALAISLATFAFAVLVRAEESEKKLNLSSHHGRIQTASSGDSRTVNTQPAQELLKNPQFAETGDGKLAAGWFDDSFGLETGPKLSVTTEDGQPSQQITAAAIPADKWAAIAQTLPGLEPGLYRFRARLKASASMTADLQIRLAPEPYTVFGRESVRLDSGKWTEVSGFAQIPAVQNQIRFMVLQNQAGTLSIADASLKSVEETALSPADKQQIERQFGPQLPPVDTAKLLAETDARIRQNRTAPLAVQVLDAQGQPVANAKVQVEHVRHHFYFGAGLDKKIVPHPNESDVDKRHRENFLKLFNYATVHLYWGSYEPKAGEPQHEAAISAARWLKEQGLTVRGHPIFWNHDSIVPGWVKASNPDPAEVRRLFDTRLAQMSQTILPELRDADVFNELTHWERFKNPLSRLMIEQDKIHVVTHYLKETKRLNPALQTVINDYDNSPAYYALLKQLLEAGAPIDIIGQQSHMHDGNWSVAQIWNTLNRLSLLQRPVLFTEHSSLSGPRKKMDWQNPVPDWNTDPENEKQQADYLEMFYRLTYSHSNCIGVVLWNYSDRGAWLGAPVGILRKDGSPKPSFEKLDALINRQWRTQGEFTTDDQGRVMVPAAFEGEYRVTSGAVSATGSHRKGTPLQLVLKP